jgi:hypothetical protein
MIQRRIKPAENEANPVRRKIIIDTDPGQDDAVAILLALGSPAEIEVLGIVAVAGNVGLAQNAKNTLQVVELRQARHAGLCRLRGPDPPQTGDGRICARQDGPRRPDFTRAESQAP